MQPLFLLHIMGLLALFLGVSLLFPAVTSLLYGEKDYFAFLLPAAVCLSLGLFPALSGKKRKVDISHKEGFAIVAFGWLLATSLGALPYIFSGALPSFSDAFFESASGFTTTGATVMTDVEGQSHGVLLWRSFTQWLGGMGIILLSIAILPLLGVGGMQLYKAEVPGPVTDKLKPRIGETAKILWQVYLLFTFIQLILLRAGGMSFFDALCHSFTTMATGGFSTKNISVEAYHSAYIEGVITFFMFLAGVNFALHYQFLKGSVRSLLKDEEFRFYALILFVVTLFILCNLMLTKGLGVLTAIRYSSFQAVSIMTTTGYSSTDFEQWSSFAQFLLLLLMFIGGCAGSTGGGVKVVRIFLLVKQGYRELYRLVHPHAVMHIKFNHGRVSTEIMDSIWGFFFLYMFIFALSTLIMSLLGMDMLSAATAVATSIGNVGPGLGTVGPLDNFAHVPAVGKWVLSACMILGRLEIYTLIILLVPEYWKK